MTTNYEGDVPLFNKSEDEAVYWKDRSKFFEDKYYQLLRSSAKRAQCDFDEDQEIDNKDPVKKARFEIDPFKVFPQHVCELILNHVNAMDDIDLYRLTKVSSCWNEAVQNYKPTAERINEMLNLDLYTDAIEDEGMAPILALWMKTNFEIQYKTASIPINKFGYSCLMKFSSSFEHLYLCEQHSRCFEFDSNPMKHCAFPKLRNLGFYYMNWNIFDQLTNCTFPVIQKLEMPDADINGYDKVQSFNAFFAKMPTIEQLCMRGVKFSFKDFDDKMLEAPFRLKSLCLHACMENFLQMHADTLENLAIKEFKQHKQIEFILKNMKKLKFLSIGSSYLQDEMDYDSDDDESPFVDYSNVVSRSYGDYEEDYDDEVRERYAKEDKETIEKSSIEFKNKSITTLFIAKDLDEFIKYIPAFTSVETLIIHDNLGIKQIKFIASNAPKLKKIICEYFFSIEKEYYAAFLLKEADNQMVNKNIDIVCNTSKRYAKNPNKTFCNF